MELNKSILKMCLNMPSYFSILNHNLSVELDPKYAEVLLHHGRACSSQVASVFMHQAS